EAAPGDDCDDTTQSVSPGSSEVCDGRDNDCDGYGDVLDATVGLAGSPRSIYGTMIDLRRVDIVWDGSQFFFVADGLPDADSGTWIYSGYAPVNGGPPVAQSMGYGYDSPRVASVGGTLGAVVRHVGRSSGPQFHILDTSGMPLTSSHMNGAQGTLSESDGEFTLVSVVVPTTPGDSFNTFYFTTGAMDGTVGPLTTR